MKLLSRILNGSPAHPPLTPAPEPQPEPGETPKLIEFDHEISGEDYDRIRARFRAASARNLPPQVLPDPPVVTPVTCTALTTKHDRCLLTPQPGSDRCAMPAHSHERQP